MNFGWKSLQKGRRLARQKGTDSYSNNERRNELLLYKLPVLCLKLSMALHNGFTLLCCSEGLSYLTKVFL